MASGRAPQQALQRKSLKRSGTGGLKLNEMVSALSFTATSNSVGHGNGANVWSCGRNNANNGWYSNGNNGYFNNNNMYNVISAVPVAQVV